MLPWKRASSTWSLAIRSLRWGSMSAAVSNLRDLPSREKSLADMFVMLTENQERLGAQQASQMYVK